MPDFDAETIPRHNGILQLEDYTCMDALLYWDSVFVVFNEKECRHCDRVIGIFEKELAHINSINESEVAFVNCQSEKEVCAYMHITSFPTIRYFYK